MHNLLARFNAIGTHAGTVLFVCAALSAVTTLWLEKTPEITVNLTLQSLRDDYPEFGPNGKADLAVVQMNLKADLTPLFNWNTKNIYFFLVAEFNTTTTANEERTPNNNNSGGDGGEQPLSVVVRNEVTIWDTVISHKKEANINLINENVKYPLCSDRTGVMKGSQVLVTPKWMIFPITGLLKTSQSSSMSQSFRFTLPDSYHRRS